MGVAGRYVCWRGCVRLARLGRGTPVLRIRKESASGSAIGLSHFIHAEACDFYWNAPRSSDFSTEIEFAGSRGTIKS